VRQSLTEQCNIHATVTSQCLGTVMFIFGDVRVVGQGREASETITLEYVQ